VDEKNKPAAPLKLVVSRGIDAPAELVFDAWLDAATLGKWLFATPDGEMQRVDCDPRVGGKFVVIEKRGEMLAEHVGTYVELDRPRRLVFMFGVPQFSSELTRVTIDIAPDGAGCRLTLTHEGVLSEYRERTHAGWTMILDGLSSTLFADREYVCSRMLDFPREQVFRAFSDPEQLAKWWGPDGFTNTILKFDFHPGGDWHLTMHGPDGTDYRNESVFVEINEPERIVYDHLRTMHRFLMDMSYFDFDGKTRLTWRQRFESAEEWERVKAFVPEANEQNFDRLEKHLQAQQ
jgi:uncharacterized protein YndB with AHSA1/START domain